MSNWLMRNAQFIGWGVLLLLLTVIAIESHEANRNSTENNQILLERNAKFEELKREHAETHQLVVAKCGG